LSSSQKINGMAPVFILVYHIRKRTGPWGNILAIPYFHTP
jgi:hypothetical protein